MHTRKILKNFGYFVYFVVTTIVLLAGVLFIITTDATLYENSEKRPSPYDKDVSNLFEDLSLIDAKNILSSYEQINEKVKTLKNVKHLVGCQINFDKNEEPYSYQFYFAIKPKGRFVGSLRINVGTGLIENFSGVSAYEDYTHFWLSLTEPGIYTHKKLKEKELEKRILHVNKEINKYLNRRITVYVTYNKTVFHFEEQTDKLERRENK